MFTDLHTRKAQYKKTQDNLPFFHPKKAHHLQANRVQSNLKFT